MLLSCFYVQLLGGTYGLQGISILEEKVYLDIFLAGIGTLEMNPIGMKFVGMLV